ncbi:FAD-dependent oxidoreductase [Streptomyces sp. CS62]
MADAALPVIVLSDPDPLRRHETAELVQSWYRTSFRVLQVGGPAEMARALNSLADRRVPVAAVLADEAPAPGAAQHPGVRWIPLARHRDDAPAAAESREAAAAGSRAEDLRGALDDSLCTWNADSRGELPTAEVRGSRFSPAAYAVRDFLGRSGVIFRWLPEQEARDAPVTVRLGDGTEMADPSISELAERLGLIRPAGQDHYDVAVIGGGPGGLSAAVYAAAEGMSVVVIEDDAPGGQAGTTSRIENYLGFPTGLTGGDLAQRALQQARRARVEWQPTRVASRVSPAEGGRHRIDFVKAGTDETASVTAAAVVVATGVDWNRLTAPGVDRLLNSGVYYGSCLSDAPSAAGEDVYMVGAGNSAGQAALYFARYARTVTLLVRGTDLGASMSDYLVRRIGRTPGLRVLLGTEVAECARRVHPHRPPAPRPRRRGADGPGALPVRPDRRPPLDRLARRHARPRRPRLHPHRERRRRGGRTADGDERPRRLRRRRCALRIGQACRRRRGGGRRGRPVPGRVPAPPPRALPGRPRRLRLLTGTRPRARTRPGGARPRSRRTRGASAGGWCSALPSTAPPPCLSRTPARSAASGGGHGPAREPVRGGARPRFRRTGGAVGGRVVLFPVEHGAATAALSWTPARCAASGGGHGPAREPVRGGARPRFRRTGGAAGGRVVLFPVEHGAATAALSWTPARCAASGGGHGSA